MIKYIAFLRAINVGGHQPLKMNALAHMFESFGVEKVRTIIASGNVLFESDRKNESVLTRQIEEGLREKLGYTVETMVRTLPEIEEMIGKNPFKKIKPSENVKTYVTFLAEEKEAPMALPFKSPKKDFEILSKTRREVFSISLILADGHFGNPAGFIEKAFKIPATTRNWNTLLRINNIAKEA
jgi:uncharacterized protein (DUF1697 family)